MALPDNSATAFARRLQLTSGFVFSFTGKKGAGSFEFVETFAQTCGFFKKTLHPRGRCSMQKTAYEVVGRIGRRSPKIVTSTSSYTQSLAEPEVPSP